MPDVPIEVALPLLMLLAWISGEAAYRWLGLPRISAYALTGFVVAPSRTGLLPSGPDGALLLLANIGFGLLLFECGYRFNPRWLLAALAMATSPATVVRVVNEVRSSGQVSERALRLSAINSVLAVFAFKLIVAAVILKTS